MNAVTSKSKEVVTLRVLQGTEAISDELVEIRHFWKQCSFLITQSSYYVQKT